MSGKTIELKITGKYPCQFDDLIDNKRKTRVSISTLKDAVLGGYLDDLNPKPGITKKEDGIYDILVDVNELTLEIVNKSLEELSKITGTKYILK